jgi:hypothetical protein
VPQTLLSTESLEFSASILLDPDLMNHWNLVAHLDVLNSEYAPSDGFIEDDVRT